MEVWKRVEVANLMKGCFFPPRYKSAHFETRTRTDVEFTSSQALKFDENPAFLNRVDLKKKNNI